MLHEPTATNQIDLLQHYIISYLIAQTKSNLHMEYNLDSVIDLQTQRFVLAAVVECFIINIL